VKKIVSVLSISVLMFAGSSGLVSANAANAANSPKPGSSCAMGTSMTGGSKIIKKKIYVCMPDGTWSKGLTKRVSALTTKDMWMKSADKGMTAGFGMIANATSKDIRIIAVRSNGFTSVAQLHEMGMGADGQMVMQEKEDGLVISAGETVELKPGGNHIMFMNLKKPVTPGTLVPVILIGSNGEQLRFTALGKVYSGANETYDPSRMSGM
jgi:copper(I)-binding protein